jgi:hypothetical protein
MSIWGLPWAGVRALLNFTPEPAEGPARIHIRLRRLGWFVGPDLVGCLACLDRILLLLRVALLEGCNEHGVNDLPSHREIAVGAQPIVERIEEHLDRLRFGRTCAEEPDRVGVGCRRAKVEAQKAQPAVPIPYRVFHPRISNIILSGQYQYLEHRNTAVGRASALFAPSE